MELSLATPAEGTTHYKTFCAWPTKLILMYRKSFQSITDNPNCGISNAGMHVQSITEAMLSVVVKI